MGKNYYNILGIPHDATIKVIQAAYRDLAKKHHPDLGGSHENMIELNEAWEILSDPIFRQEYDYASDRKEDPMAQYSANQNSKRARHSAAQYPRKWSEFEFWLNGVTKDFKNAEYGTFSGPGSVPLPSAGKSFSGWLFIVVGLIAGAFLAANIIIFLDLNSRSVFSKIFGVLILALGGWLGLFLHAYFGKLLQSDDNE